MKITKTKIYKADVPSNIDTFNFLQKFTKNNYFIKGIKLVKFGPIWSDHYPICDAIMEQLAECGFPVYLADTDTMDSEANSELINKYKITEVPTYILFNGARELQRFDKSTTFTQLKSILKIKMAEQAKNK